MSTAAKHRKRALEFEQLKQFDKAIAAYVRAIDEEEASGEDVDVALYNKVGDLTMRLGRVPDAVTYYERAVDRYATVGLFNNAIALCNKILRHAPGRSSVYFTLGRICARKGLRGDASRNFLEYASRMRAENRTDEAMRALAEVAELMPELEEVRGLVEEHAARAGIVLKRRETPAQGVAVARKSGVHDLVFLDVAYELPDERTGMLPAHAAHAAHAHAAHPGPDVSRPAAASPSNASAPPSHATSDPFGGLLIFDPTTATPVASPAIAPAEPAVVEGATSADHDAILPGLEANHDFGDPGVASLAGFTATELETESVPVSARDTLPRLEALTSDIEVVAPVEATGIVRNDAYLGDGDGDGQPSAAATVSEEPLEDLESMETLNDFGLSADNHDGVDDVTADSIVVESIAVEAVPELDDAIAAGAATAAVEASPSIDLIPQAAPVRFDPHDFILPGELPPLVVPESLLSSAVGVDVSPVPDVPEDAVARQEPPTFVTPRAATPRSSTPLTPMPVVVAEAVAHANARFETLRAALDERPHDHALRHRFAEALIEQGEREQGIAELEAVLQGFVTGGDILSAFEIAEQLVQVAEGRLRHHQKRVELAVRLGDAARIRITYLDLADLLVRMGEEARAHAVYARVLEIDPYDERARTALGAAAPPLPEAQATEEYVDLGSWLRGDGADTTRMRMREPTITGDEQADFDSLLRHFKEGVARSLGDDDHDSHYDLGVAYKEMGLLDDAIGEFQKALRSRVHRLPAYEALGQCFVEQGRFEVASTVLTRALHEPGQDDTHRIGVLYLLGYSAEALQREDDARSYFARVQSIDRNFRDVGARLAALPQVAR